MKKNSDNLGEFFLTHTVAFI